MAQQKINLGVDPNGIGGDTERAAFTKCNLNFDEIYASGLIERGSNAKGEYAKLPDGTLLTWGKQIVNVAVPAGQGVTWNPGTANQPFAFVGTPISDVKYCMMIGANGTGNPLYTSSQNYYQNGDIIQVGINMGAQPAAAHPVFTYGPTAAASYIVFFSCVGRWK